MMGTGFPRLLAGWFVFAAALAIEIPPEKWDPEFSTPGVEVDLEELNRSKIDFVTAITYRIEVSGFPAGKDYAIWYKPPDHPAPRILSTGWTVNESGEFVCSRPEGETSRRRHPADPSCREGRIEDGILGVKGFFKAQPLIVGIVSEDERVVAFAKEIPFPLESSAGECRVRAELVSDKKFLFSGEGFRPGEIVKTVSRAGKESIEEEIPVGDQGEFSHLVLLPRGRGRDGGKARYQVTGGECSVTLKYKWGDALSLQ